MPSKYGIEEAGLTWTQAEEYGHTWESFGALGLSWSELEALYPAGHWRDELCFTAAVGQTVLAQLDALRIRTSPTPRLTLSYDPEALEWTGGFVRGSVGLPVGEALPLPAVAAAGSGRLVLECQKQAAGNWSGLLAALPFVAKRAGVHRITLE